MSTNDGAHGRDARLEGNWDQLKGRVREAWGALTDDDVDRVEGRWEQLVGTIRERTGESLDQVETKLNEIVDKLEASPGRSGG
jgi:uncharacterized protein YjbJ (UPF0337 family)